MIIYQIIGCICNDKTIEDEDIKYILCEMKAKIDKCVEYEQTSSNLLFQSELNAIKTSIKNIKDENESIIIYYFNIFYFYLVQRFGTFLVIVSLYAIISFALDIFELSTFPETIIRLCIFVVFVFISFIISIKRTFFGKSGSSCSKIKYWFKKSIWSFLICIGLLISD